MLGAEVSWIWAWLIIFVAQLRRLHIQKNYPRPSQRTRHGWSNQSSDESDVECLKIVDVLETSVKMIPQLIELTPLRLIRFKSEWIMLRSLGSQLIPINKCDTDLYIFFRLDFLSTCATKFTYQEVGKIQARSMHMRNTTFAFISNQHHIMWSFLNELQQQVSGLINFEIKNCHTYENDLFDTELWADKVSQ